jgi:hypothetical protein
LRKDSREYRWQFYKWKQVSGIIHQTTCRYTSQQNGVSERANRTAWNRIRQKFALQRSW